MLDHIRHFKHRIVRFFKKPIDSTHQGVRQQWSALNSLFDHECSFSKAFEKHPDSIDLYRYMHHYFHQRSPKRLREHRNYFLQEQRGFGEDAMHAMWWLLFLEERPQRCLEIGVYRGQVISLWTQLSQMMGYSAEIHGISPLTPAGDVVTGEYLDTIDYEQDIIQNFAHFQLGKPQLCKAYSTDQRAIDTIESQKWDLIYIDGSHDYDVVVKDYDICKANLTSNGWLIFDDAAAQLPYSPPPFAFAGHPDPSRLIVETVQNEMTLIGNVGHNVIFKKH